MFNEITSKRIERFVIFLSIAIAVVCGFDTYKNYDDWKTYAEKSKASGIKYDEQMYKCAQVDDEKLRMDCSTTALRWSKTGEYLEKSLEYKEDMKLSVKRWIVIQLTLLALYFGMRWVWTGRVKS